jgi:dienelactone hydrolase
MAAHEPVIAKSLLAAGTTFAGMVLAEDRLAMRLLAARDDVDPARLGCCGLSGGGLRAVYLAGMEPGIACVVCAGMMTTWRDIALAKSRRHSWMMYLPGLPQALDFPDILALAAPAPSLVLSCGDDALFTRHEVERGHAMVAASYGKADIADRHRGVVHDGPHRFDRAMQGEAFAWLRRWLA